MGVRLLVSSFGIGVAITLAALWLGCQGGTQRPGASTLTQLASPTLRPSPTVSTEFSGCLNEAGIVDIRGSDSFTDRTREAMDVLPEEYLTLVNCWLIAIVDGSSPSGRSGVVAVRAGTYYVASHNEFVYDDPQVGAVSYASGMVHEAVHVREYWQGRPFEGRDVELTALRAQLEVTLLLPTPPELPLCLMEIIDNIDNPAYQYWNGASPPCKFAGTGPATPTPT
jgi:hypothetical protein